MATRKSPEMVYRDGKPVAVILDIDRYEELLERLEEADDLRALRRQRSKPLKYRTLDEFMAELSERV